MSTAPPTRMSGEEFVHFDRHAVLSLVGGMPVVEVSERTARRSQVSAAVGGELQTFVKANRLGTVCGDTTRIRLKRNPDTVYAPDLCFFRNGRLSPEARAAGVCEVVPDLVLEVRTPSIPYPRMMSKVADYMSAGVRVVLVVDLGLGMAVVFGREVRHYYPGDELALPDVLPGFALPVSRVLD